MSSQNVPLYFVNSPPLITAEWAFLWTPMHIIKMLYEFLYS